MKYNTYSFNNYLISHASSVICTVKATIGFRINERQLINFMESSFNEVVIEQLEFTYFINETVWCLTSYSINARDLTSHMYNIYPLGLYMLRH